MIVFSSKKSGFTLIEIIVSLALFSVVITIAVGALLVLITANRQLQNEQSVLSNLSFALDSMTREIRTGSDYLCVTAGSVDLVQNVFDANASNDVTADCFEGRTSDSNPFHGIIFTEGGDSITQDSGSQRIVYFHDAPEGKLYRRLNNENAESIVSDGIYIQDVDFYVSGSAAGSVDGTQPKLTVVVTAYNTEADADADATGERAYIIQTTVTQRTLDI